MPLFLIHAALMADGISVRPLRLDRCDDTEAGTLVA